MAEVAVAVGVSVALSALTYALTPKPEPQRQQDLAILKSEYGVAIPKVYGTHKVTGNVIWGLDIEESKTGGKGGNEKFEYSGTFAVSLCEGEIESIDKIWLSNRLVYSKGTGDSNTEQSSQGFEDEYCTFYLGSNNQPIDSTIEAHEGVENTPAFNNLAYIVFENLPLAKYGNVIPTVQATVTAKSNTTLSEILDDVCLKSGLIPSEFDTSLLQSQIVYGALFEQDNQSAREFIQSLQKAFHFLARDSGNKVEFFPINQSSYVDIPLLDLASHEANSEIESLYSEIREQPLDLPSSLQLEYPNINNNFKKSLQTIYKSTASHFNEINESTQVALSDSQALTAVKKSLDFYWQQRVRFEGLKLPPKYLGLKAGDLISLPIRNTLRLLQISKINQGANLLVEIDTVSYNENINNLVITSPTDDDYNTIDLVDFLGNPTAVVIDLNLLDDEDSDTGLYGTVIPDINSSGWDGGVIAASPAIGSYIKAATVNEEASIGSLTTSLPVSSPFIVDISTKFQVQITQQQLENATDSDFLSGNQLASINGELVAFQNAELISANLYEISNLIRGARGTEHLIANHPVGSLFYLVKGNINFVDIKGTASQLNQTYKFKAVPDGAFSSQITNETSLLIQGNRLKPYSPVLPTLTKKSNGDIEIAWMRRSRKHGEWNDLTETIPLNESNQRYDLEILDGSNVVLTETNLTNPYYLLTLSQQNSFLGSSQSSLSFRVYQLSTLVGRGYPLIVNNLAISRFS